MSNEATNFRELLAEDLEDVFLNTEEFGEPISFYPANNGAMRRLYAVIEQNQRAVTGDGTMIDHEQEEIEVLVSKDRNGSRGGIDKPLVGDTLTREGDGERYAYSGEIRDADTSSWRLVYVRANPLGIGTNYRR